MLLHLPVTLVLNCIFTGLRGVGVEFPIPYKNNRVTKIESNQPQLNLPPPEVAARGKGPGLPPP